MAESPTPRETMRHKGDFSCLDPLSAPPTRQHRLRVERWYQRNVRKREIRSEDADGAVLASGSGPLESAIDGVERSKDVWWDTPIGGSHPETTICVKTSVCLRKYQGWRSSFEVFSNEQENKQEFTQPSNLSKVNETNRFSKFQGSSTVHPMRSANCLHL